MARPDRQRSKSSAFPPISFRPFKYHYGVDGSKMAVPMRYDASSAEKVVFTPQQFECVSKSLYFRRDGAALVRLFKDNENLLNANADQYWTDTAILAYVYAQYHSEQFDSLYETLARGRFPEKHFRELQDLWYAAHYKENERRRGKSLGAVEKYRLRRKYPPPASIWDGEETVYSFKECSRKYLKQFYKANQYPTIEQKKEICRVTELQLVQVSNWFKNRRQREKSVKAVRPSETEVPHDDDDDDVPIVAALYNGITQFRP